MQDVRKAVWSIPYVSVAFYPSLKQNLIAYRSSSRPDCIFEIHQLWQSGFSRMYSNCYCSCSFEPEIIKLGQSSHKMYNNNIVNFQESTTVLNASTKKSGNLLKAPHMSVDLVWELKKLWNIKVTVISIAIAGICIVTKGLVLEMDDLKIRGWVETIQTTALLRSAKILGKVLETWGDLLSLRLQWKIIS